MSATSWRLRCPEGHLSWRPSGSGYYCEPCGEWFDRLIDAKTGRAVA